MPVKKKPVVHHIKKKPTTVEKSETVEGKVEEKKERPVMQVVQVGEESSASESETQTQTSQQPAATPAPAVEPVPVPVESTVTPVSPSVEPVSVASESQPATPEVKKEEAVNPNSNVDSQPTPVSTTPTNVVSATSATPTPSETFLEGLPEKSSSKKGLIFLLVIVLILLCGCLGGYIYWQQGGKLPQGISLPMLSGGKSSLLKTQVTPTVVVTATPTPTAVDKTQYSVEVLNGSGVRGEAAKAKDSLTTDGFSVDATGNADTTDYTQTIIKAKATVSQAFLTTLMTTLSKTYAVSSTTMALSASSQADVVVIIGSTTAK